MLDQTPTTFFLRSSVDSMVFGSELSQGRSCDERQTCGGTIPTFAPIVQPETQLSITRTYADSTETWKCLKRSESPFDEGLRIGWRGQADPLIHRLMGSPRTSEAPWPYPLPDRRAKAVLS